MKYIIAVLAIGTLISCASAQKKVKKNSLKKHSSMNAKFMEEDLNVKLWQEKFENRDRDVYKNRVKIVEALNLKAGETVADVGAGTGFFLKLIHDKVGTDGKVYASELSSKFVEFIEARAQLEKLENVIAVKSSLVTTNLEVNSVDKIFVCDTYHHFDHPEAMIRDFYRVLKPGGELIIVDFDRISGKSRKWILSHIKKTKEEYIKDISKEFFKYSHESKINLEENFMLHFRKN